MVLILQVSALYRDWFWTMRILRMENTMHITTNPGIWTFTNLIVVLVILWIQFRVAINDSAISVGVAFSPIQKYFYLSSTNYVYQFVLTASNIAASKTTVAVYDGYYSLLSHHSPLRFIWYN